jgi:hypothetical protein
MLDCAMATVKYLLEAMRAFHYVVGMRPEDNRPRRRLRAGRRRDYRVVTGRIQSMEGQARSCQHTERCRRCSHGFCGFHPNGAEIEVDGEFMGNTPSVFELDPGEHNITVKKTGYKDWEKKVKLTAGEIKLNAELEAEASK